MKEFPYPTLPSLIIDDTPYVVQLIASMLRHSGMGNIVCCEDSRKAFSLIGEKEIGVILLDLRMPHVSGEKILSHVVENKPEIPVIILTGANEVETAVKCMKLGAFDFMVKPVEKDSLVSVVRRAVEFSELRRENTLLRQRLLSESKLKHPESFHPMVTRDKNMLSIFRYIEVIAKTDQPVLITGETGVGKELVACSIHEISGRNSFNAVNVASLDDNVFSDTLFGHVKGAFTGAHEQRTGLVMQAAEGTLFLDEIGDLGNTSQLKLLRLLQEREYFPLGSDTARRSDARVLVATNRNLRGLQDSGKFRKDLYYRLRTHRIHIPPLRERMNDLPLLLDHFLEKSAESLGKKKPTPPKELLTLLSGYHFPGNVRELQSMVFDAVSNHHSGKLSMKTFKAVIMPRNSYRDIALVDAKCPEIVFSEKLPTIKNMTALLVKEAMKRSNGNQSIAAGLLGISQQALSKRLKKLRE